MIVKVFLALLPRRKRKTPNKESSRKGYKRVSSRAMIHL